MRVRISAGKDGQQIAANIGGMLQRRGFQLSEHWPQLSVVVDAAADSTNVVISGKAGELESNIVHWITQMLAQAGDPRAVVLRRHGPMTPESVIVVLPADEKIVATCEQAIVAAVEVTLRGKPAPKWKFWRSK